MPLTRRQMLASSAMGGIGIALSGSVGSIAAAGPALGATRSKVGYGDLVRDPAGMLDLPRGFTYTVVSRTGQPLASGPGLVPERHDGMATFPGPRRDTYLVRNHEVGVADDPASSTRASVDPAFVYDATRDGGTSTLRVDDRGRLKEEYVSLAGTSTNCAGGRTPWGTWLTCEETESPGATGITHGWVFEVDPQRKERNRNPTPLTAMGRFAHEAVAVDPRTGTLYETEDAGSPNGLFFRFTPNEPLGGYGSLREGGSLEAMSVPGVPDLSVVQEVGATFGDIIWRTVPDPAATTTPVRRQFGAGQVTRSRKLEGTWTGDDGIFFVSSFARTSDGSGADHDGQVWLYTPWTNELSLVLIFRPGDTPFESPDNITVSPWGGVILAEDGSGDQFLVGATETGEAFAFAQNRVNLGSAEDPSYSEFAGVTYSPDGRTLYANVQEPGITYAIRGPWKKQHKPPKPPHTPPGPPAPSGPLGVSGTANGQGGSKT